MSRITFVIDTPMWGAELHTLAENLGELIADLEVVDGDGPWWDGITATVETRFTPVKCDIRGGDPTPDEAIPANVWCPRCGVRPRTERRPLALCAPCGAEMDAAFAEPSSRDVRGESPAEVRTPHAAVTYQPGNRLSEDHYRKVADVVSAAQSAGMPMLAAVQEAFSTSQTSAANWVARARHLGLIPPAGPRAGRVRAGKVAAAPKPVLPVSAPSRPVAKPEAPQVKVDVFAKTPTPVVEPIPDLTLSEPAADADAALAAAKGTLEQVAEIYLRAVRENRRPIGELVDQFDAHRVTVGEWVQSCRDRGLLPPKGLPQVESVAPRAGAVPRGHRSLGMAL